MNILYNDDVYRYIKDNINDINEYLINNDLSTDPNNQEDAALQMLDDEFLNFIKLLTVKSARSLITNY